MNVGIIYFVLFYLLLRFTTQRKQKTSNFMVLPNETIYALDRLSIFTLIFIIIMHVTCTIRV